MDEANFVKYSIDDLPYGDIGCVVCKVCAALVPDQEVARNRHQEYHSQAWMGLH